MAFTKYRTTATNTRKENLPKFTIIDKHPTISGARAISEKCVLFTLNVDGASFYDLRVVAGNKGPFISMPQGLGSDGKYYDKYRLFFEEKEAEKIIDAVASHYAGKGEVIDYKTRFKVEV